jgi:hypothetical protein
LRVAQARSESEVRRAKPTVTSRRNISIPSIFSGPPPFPPPPATAWRPSRRYAVIGRTPRLPNRARASQQSARQRNTDEKYWNRNRRMGAYDGHRTASGNVGRHSRPQQARRNAMQQNVVENPQEKTAHRLQPPVGLTSTRGLMPARPISFQRLYYQYVGLCLYKTHPGGQQVRMSLPQGRRVTRRNLRGEKDIPFTGGTGTIEFTMPGVPDYEVAALHAA